MAKRVGDVRWFYGFVPKIDPWLEEMESRDDLRRTVEIIGRHVPPTTVSPISVPRRGTFRMEP